MGFGGGESITRWAGESPSLTGLQVEGTLQGASDGVGTWSLPDKDRKASKAALRVMELNG